MTKFKFLLLVLLSISFGLYSCGSDDNEDEIIKSSDKKITKFVVNEVQGVIDESKKTITLTFPPKTDVKALKPIITLSDKATVYPKSEDVVNLSTLVSYTVTAEDKSTQKYEVTAIVAKSTDAKITSFDINNLDPKVLGVINEEAKTIALEVPFGTNLTKITPTIAFLAEKISPNTEVETDFTQPVVYTVTPEEGSAVKYTVTVAAKAFEPAITKVEPTTVVIGRTIKLEGKFAKESNVVKLVKGQTILELAIIQQNETAITAVVSKDVTDFGDYTLSVTSHDVKVEYGTKIKITDIPTPTITKVTPESPEVGKEVIITGTNFGTIEDTRISVFVYNSLEQAWIRFIDEITPTSVTSTEVKFILTGDLAGSEIKLHVGVMNKGSELSEKIIVFNPNRPIISSLDKQQYTIGLDNVILKGQKLLGPNNYIEIFFKQLGEESYYAQWSSSITNAEGTEVVFPLPVGLKLGKQLVCVKVNDMLSNEVELEILANTSPNPVITQISTLTPAEDQMITITGSNFSTLDDTRIRVYTYNSFEQAWVPFGFDLKPKAVRGTTEVDIVLQGFSSGDQLKVIVMANGKGSALSEVIKIQ